MTKHPVKLVVNGNSRQALVEPRLTLADLLRDHLGLTGTHLGCEHGVCGSCTILLNGETVRSCLMLAVQASGAEILTVEGLAGRAGASERLHAIQEAFVAQCGLQCGYCTPGFLMTTYELLRENPSPDESQIRERLSGNLCRCTGYQNIVAAVQAASALLHRQKTP